MADDLKKYRVTGPDGFEMIVAADTPMCLEPTDVYALAEAWGHTEISSIQGKADCLRQAGYRAEPIEEPKMVTVRAEDLLTLYHHAYGASSEWPTRVRVAVSRLRAALDGAK